MPEVDSLVALLAFAAVMAVAGVVHGTLGLGFPLVATSLLALFLDVRLAILLTLLPTAAVNVVSIARGGQWHSSIGRFWPLAVYALFGSVVGAGVLLVNDPSPFKLVLGCLVLLFLATNRLGSFGMGWVKTYLPLSMLAFGLVAGLSGGTTNVMVPILIIFSLKLDLERTAMVQVFNLCFLAGKLAQIGVFTAAGLFTLDAALATLPLAAVAIVALVFGMRIRDKIPTEVYQRLLRQVLFALAVLLIGQFAYESA